MTDPFESTIDDWETYKLLENASVEEIAQIMKALLERLQHLAADGDKEAQMDMFRNIKYAMFYMTVAEKREAWTGGAPPAPSLDDITFLQSEGISVSLKTPAEDIKKAYWRVAAKHLPHVKEGYDQQERYDQAVTRLAELS